MPNWCLNKIKISGNKKNRRRVSQIIENLHEQDDDEIGLLESLVGKDPTISEEDYFNGGWYESNINYWGTKWDLADNDFIFEETEDSIHLEFETAWSPPIEFCELLSKKYGVGVKIKYFEPGLGLSGIFEVDNNGEKIRDDYYQNLLEGLYNYDKSMFWEKIENIIEEYFIDKIELGEDFFIDYDIDKEKTHINNFANFITLEDLKKVEKIINDKKKKKYK
jgi:hypothetical protein